MWTLDPVVVSAVSIFLIVFGILGAFWNDLVAWDARRRRQKRHAH